MNRQRNLLSSGLQSLDAVDEEIPGNPRNPFLSDRQDAKNIKTFKKGILEGSTIFLRYVLDYPLFLLIF